MNRIFLLLFLSIFISFNAISQVVTVKRERNKLAIAEVYVFGTANGFSGSTNGAGKLALGELSPNDSLYFQHPGYVKKGIVVQDLKATSNIVFLEDRIIMLPEIVFSATKRVENQREVANQLEKIDASDIVFNNPQTTADVIDQTGQVFVQKSQQGGGSPMIRGFAANRLLIVVDGVRMNNAIFREGNLQNLILVDPNSLESAEVLFGPSSTLYGSDALGGVMNLSSKKTTYSDSFNLYGGAFTRTQTANKEATAHLDLGFSWENFSLFNSITVSDFDDLRSGTLRPLDYPDFGKRFTYVRNVNGVDRVDSSKDVNVQRSTGYQQLNALQKIGWKVNDDIEVTNSFHFTTSGDIPRYDRLTQLNPDSSFRFGDWHYGPQTWVLNALNVKLSNKNALYDVLNITPAYQFFNEERVSRRFGQVDESHRIEKVQLITTNVDADKQLNDDQSILYGLEFAFNTVNSTAFQQNINTNTKSPESTRYPDGGSTYNTSAAYISFEQKIDDRYIFSAGTRYSYVSLNSKFEDSTFFSFPYDEINLKTGALNGSVGLVFTPTKAVQVNGILSTGFRAPNIDDIGKVFDSQPGVLVVPNPGLKSEYAYNGELGFIIRKGRLKAEVNGFYTVLTNAIVRRPFTFNGQDSVVFEGQISEVQALTNTGQAVISGFSTTLKYSFTKDLVFSTSGTYVQGRDLDGDLPLRHVSPPFGLTSLRYDQEQYSFEFYARYSGGIKAEDLAPSEQGKPHVYPAGGALPWYTLNIKTSLSPKPNLTLQIGVENLLDLHYRTYSSGISAAGRNFILGLRASF